jgi:DNA polymerase-3 subunit epsilon
MSSSLPRAGTDTGVEPYLAVLDTVLEDRRVTATEMASLHDLAISLGISSDVAIAAHQMYLRALAVAAWADGIITDAERADLGEVAHLLGFPAQAVGRSWLPYTAHHHRQRRPPQ